MKVINYVMYCLKNVVLCDFVFGERKSVERERKIVERDGVVSGWALW